MSGVIFNQINTRLKSFRLEDNAIVVLKGIPLSIIDSTYNDLDLKNVIDSPMMYFMNDIFGKNRKFISYEEFILLSSFILAQYKKVYIITNNIYISMYPIEQMFSNEVKNGLLNHFMETENDSEDDRVIGDISEYIGLYNGIKEYNGYLLGSYCDDKIPSNEKIVNVELFDERDSSFHFETSTEYLDILEEDDYIDFVKRLFLEPLSINIKIDNYTGNENYLLDRLLILQKYWADATDINIVKTQEGAGEFEHREEYTNILKQYWGYDSYRTLKVYDMDKLDDGIKETYPISQEQIISELVEQVENCEKGAADFRDVFVTAPTGAGKSVMFQVPAMYLAEKYNLFTIVISPLIGLMNDQIQGLETRDYRYAETINSDISPIIKNEITEKITNNQCHILYISPETLLSRSDVEKLIGDRTIGMIVVDEAHIVTTWGKQFRPDYWYLGDHIKKLRKKQLKDKGRSFVVATFTATAIYHGVEDMYRETINSLHMINPIRHLGYVKREDINIVIKKEEAKEVRTEYEPDKFKQIEELIKRSIVTNKKVLIYFPTVALINRCYEYLESHRMISNVTKYHGALPKDMKEQNYEEYHKGEKKVMLATKAFGMGIDINNIEIVAHFAPTGNVCDYVQEIGRAARREDLKGEAFYNYNTRDFKHINRLHGLSTIYDWQLIAVMKKIVELYRLNLQKSVENKLTRKRNAMLVDAENFSYIFGKTDREEDDNINKVKTALLIIQKDFESKFGFSPVNIRPIPLFSIGFFKVSVPDQRRLKKEYGNCIEVVEESLDICRIKLDSIWNKTDQSFSFAKFKYLIYSKSEELDFNMKYNLIPALSVSIEFASDYRAEFNTIWRQLRAILNQYIISGTFVSIEDIAIELAAACSISKYKAKTFCDVVIASMTQYRSVNHTMSSIFTERLSKSGLKYTFNVAIDSYFNWVEKGLRKIEDKTENNQLYIVNDGGNYIKEINIILGILESMGILSFEMIGGANSQLYIYMNQVANLQKIIDNPSKYSNRLLESVSERHRISVEMLTYLYEGDFTSDERWDMLEDYFLGKIPVKVKNQCIKVFPGMKFDLE